MPLDIGDGPLDDDWLQEDPEQIAADEELAANMAEIDAVERPAEQMGVAVL